VAVHPDQPRGVIVAARSEKEEDSEEEGSMTVLTAAAELSESLEEVIPDVGLIAQNLSQSAKQNGRKVSPQQLESAITKIQVQSINIGSPSLTVSLIDPEWQLLDSGFFDTDKDGILDRIELVYPPPDSSGIDYRWVATRVSPKGADHTIQMVFWNWYADQLTRINPKATPKLAPIKAQRGQVTRAQFLKQLASKVHGLEFYCQQLDKKQPTAGVVQGSTSSSIKQPAKQGGKTPGVGANSGTLTCKGVPLTNTQLQIINIALGVANQLNAPGPAIEAMMYAAMGESTISVESGGGVWQDLSSPNPSDIAAEAHAFLTGQFGFQQGGAIACARRGDPVWMIANEVEANLVWSQSHGDSYGHQWNGGQAEGLAEAAAIVSAGGGSTSGPGSVTTTTSTVEPYYFTVGTSSNPNESYWAAMQRLAQEVNWPLILIGNRMYYDSEPTMARAKPAAHLVRDGAAIADWNYDWDARAICTGMTVALFSDPFDFAAGDVFTLEGFGTAATASTVKLPGRWLVAQIDRDRSSLQGTFTLKQPSLPNSEPAPQVQTTTATAQVSSGGYVDPLTGATYGRIDMGIDGHMTPGAPIKAPGKIKIVGITPSWYAGQPYIWWQLLDGPDAGKYQYVAEQITQLATVGSTLNQGDAICKFASSGTGFEFGWGTATAQTLAQATTGYTEGEVTTAGKSIAQWLTAQGAKGVTAG
jgi:hypothetical protein